MPSMSPIALVIPCYNEARRLVPAAFLEMIDRDPALSLVLVDDGSNDETAKIHASMAGERPDRIARLGLVQNGGKGEAVRQGMLAALRGSAEIVGFADADLATPSVEIARLCAVLREHTDCDVLLGARVRMLGRSIDRNPLRHYLGRAFATAASLILRLPVYDTQCGAKLFRRSPALERALARPFLSRWVFDLELLGRLLMGEPTVPGIPVERIREEPLLLWSDRSGSKLSLHQMARSLVDLGRVEAELGKRRPGRAEACPPVE